MTRPHRHSRRAGGRRGYAHGASRSLLKVDGLDLHVTGLYAIGGNPVCDLARYFKEMDHAARYASQPGTRPATR